jgi:hypothetical protein
MMPLDIFSTLQQGQHQLEYKLHDIYGQANTRIWRLQALVFQTHPIPSLQFWIKVNKMPVCLLLYKLYYYATRAAYPFCVFI